MVDVCYKVAMWVEVVPGQSPKKKENHCHILDMVGVEKWSNSP
jgi:hypothetical protein